MSIASFAESNRLGTTQVVDYDASVAITNPFGVQTYMIRVVANSACHIKVGDGAQTATATDPYLPAQWIEYIRVTPGQRISAIKAPTGGLNTATAGRLTVTELGA